MNFRQTFNRFFERTSSEMNNQIDCPYGVNLEREIPRLFQGNFCRLTGYVGKVAHWRDTVPSYRG